MAHRLGITSIHHVVPIPAWQAYQRAHRRGGLRLRVYAMVPGTATASLAHTAIQSGLGHERLRLGSVKVFYNVSLDPLTPPHDGTYSGRPNARGSAIHSPLKVP